MEFLKKARSGVTMYYNRVTRITLWAGVREKISQWDEIKINSVLPVETAIIPVRKLVSFFTSAASFGQILEKLMTIFFTPRYST